MHFHLYTHTAVPLRISSVLWCTCFLVLRGDRTCARLIPWYGYIVASLVENPSTHSKRPPVAGPSTATLDSPRKPAGYVVFVVFLGGWLIAHVDPVVRARMHTPPLFGVHEKTVPALKSGPN